MATSSIQAFNGGALNGGFRPEDLQPLRVLTPMQSEPAAEYTPEYGADWIQRAVVFKDSDGTVIGTYRPFDSDDKEITIPDAQEQSDWAEADSSKPSFIKNKPTIPTMPPVVLMTALWDSGAGDYSYPAVSDIDDAWTNDEDVILVRSNPGGSQYFRLVNAANNSFRFARIDPDLAHQISLVAKKVGGTDTWTETMAGQWGHWVNASTWRTMISTSDTMNLATVPTLDNGSGFYQETDLKDEVFETGVYHFDMEVGFNRQSSSLTAPVMYDMTIKINTSTVFTTSITFQGKWGGANGVNETAQISGIIKVPASGKISVNLLWGGGDNTADNESKLKLSHLFLRKLYI